MRRSYKILLFSALSLTLVFLFCSTPGGLTEFSPDTFQLRSQEEWLFPIVRFPVYRSAYQYREQPELSDFLEKEGYWTKSGHTPARWVTTSHWNQQWNDGYGEMHRAFYRDTPALIEWTQAHPEIAEVLWPLVLETLRDEQTQYGGYAGHLIFIARHSETLDEFRSFVNNSPEHQAVGISVD